jgi:DNA-binding response OmpR family regulator
VARILVADDDLEGLELLKMGLEMGGHTLTTATDGKQALELGKAGEFDMYILDVTMPYMDGYHVAEALSEKYPNRKILLLTSREYDKDKVAIEACGADAHMTKPFDINELLRVVAEMTAPQAG